MKSRAAPRLLLLLLTTPLGAQQHCRDSTGAGRIVGTVLLDSIPQRFAKVALPGLQCLLSADSNGKVVILGLPLGPQRMRLNVWGLAPLHVNLMIDSLGTEQVFSMTRYPSFEEMASMPTEPTDTVVWTACFRLAAEARRSLPSAKREACGTIRLPARVLQGDSPRGFVGTHTIPFEQLAMTRGRRPGRVWASATTDSAWLTLDNFDGPLGNDTTDRALVSIMDDGGIGLVLPFRPVPGSSGEWRQSLMIGNGYGSVRFSRGE